MNRDGPGVDDQGTRMRVCHRRDAPSVAFKRVTSDGWRFPARGLTVDNCPVRFSYAADGWSWTGDGRSGCGKLQPGSHREPDR